MDPSRFIVAISHKVFGDIFFRWPVLNPISVSVQLLHSTEMKTRSILLLLILTGCSNGDDLGGRLLVAPGGYELWTCTQIANRAKSLIARQKTLEDLIAKAGTGMDGRMISMATYQPERIANRGELDSIRRTAAEKKCPPPSTTAQTDDKPTKP